MQDGGLVVLERFIPEKTKKELQQLGHNLAADIDAHGGYQGIWRKENPRRYFGASDSRKDGCAIGY